MEISTTGNMTLQQASVQVMKLSQNITKATGEQVVELINNAAPPSAPASPTVGNIINIAA
ncbi:MAG: putative motility protein [Desulfobacterales bacterium]|nr:putative motility protein [Desulfobacterales bacterium]